MARQGGGVCLLMIALGTLAAGCRSTDVAEVNVFATALRASYTDDVSRRIARDSLALMKERAADYRIGAGDVLEVSVFEWLQRDETHQVETRVPESGLILLPVLKELRVGGRTVSEVQSLVEERLKDGGILRAPRVSVSLKDFGSKRVAVLGAVEKPGTYTLSRNVTTLLAALGLAGGLTDAAGQVAHVTRAEEPIRDEGDADAPRQVVTVDMYELLELGNLDLNMALSNGDVVWIPPAQEFSVVGHVEKPGRFPIKRPVTVLEGIALAGGLDEKAASPRNCALKRRALTHEEIIPLDLVSISRGEAPNLQLAPNDVIEIRQTLLRKSLLAVSETFRSIFSVGYALK